jgi:AraC-like DNA-binding protein
MERQLNNLIYQQGSVFETVYFCSFFFRLMSSYVTLPVDSGEEDSGTPGWLSACLAYFDHNRECPISIEAIQRHSGRTPEYISRCFRKYLDTTPSTYVNQKRMAMAEQLLLDSDKTAEEIGWAVGYTSNTYFFRVFKQTYGTSPNAYRKKYRNR